MSKKSERLFQALGELDDKSVEQGVSALSRKKRHPRRWIALAACAAVILGTGAYLLPRMGGQSGSGGHDEASTFMSYAGPVFPLTLAAENPYITAARDITLDFAPWVPEWVSNEEEAAALEGVTEAERQEALEQYNEWFPEGGYYQSSSDILVTDAYTLTNTGDTDQTVTVLYPFAISLEDLSFRQPSLTADGAPLGTTLLVGSGGDFYQAEGWEDYREMLSDGDYLQKALAGLPDAGSVPVTVYAFTEPYAPPEDEEAGAVNPSIRVSMELDFDRTAVLSYGFQGGAFDWDAGTKMLEFSIPRPGENDYGQTRYLIVLGEDVTGLTAQGYVAGGVEPDTPVLAGSGVTVERYEGDLGTVLRQVFDDYMEGREALNPIDADREACWWAFLERFFQNGQPSSDGKQYGDGQLENYLSESLWQNRVCWAEAEITVPAGGSVTLTAAMAKAGSYDYICAHTKNRGVYGYDLVTKLGSNLSCTAQTATLEDRGQIEIVRQNFGFDLESGIRTVSLDGDTPHYYLEVRARKS